MKRKVVLAHLAVVIAATFGIGFAAEDTPRVPPRGTEGPDIRVTMDPQHTACPDLRMVCASGPRGVEGPEER
jgi:hypothetical protein